MKFLKNNVLTIISLALFNFIFLCTEYLFDDIMALFVDASAVVMAQNVVLGASVIGFVAFSFINDFVEDNAICRKIYLAASAVIGLICTVVICSQKSKSLVFAAGIIGFIAFGLWGSEACYRAIQRIKEKERLATIVGVSYALGILIQYINNNLVSSIIAQEIVIIIAIAIFLTAINVKKPEKLLADEIATANPINGKIALALVFMVALLTFVFSTLDNAVTLVHAAGDFNIGQYARLILGVSGLVAGLLYDIKRRKYIHEIMYGIAILSVACVIFLMEGGSFVVGLVMFYISAGFFVVYFMTAFMDAAMEQKRPSLWAGIGRGINNLVAIVISLISISAIQFDHLSLLIATLLIFAAISLVFMLIKKLDYVKQGKISVGEGEKLQELKAEKASAQSLTEEERLEKFVSQFGLTEREVDVLKELLSAEENVQTLAANLNISRAALYRHIANINEKTDTKARVGIMKKYYTWE